MGGIHPEPGQEGKPGGPGGSVPAGPSAAGLAARGGFSHQLHLSLAVGAGVVAISFAAIFIRLARAPAPVVASYRLVLASLVLLGFSLLWRPEGGVWSGLGRRNLPLVGLASVSLALHFWVWTYSLEYTSVASSVVLVTTSPFAVALASRLLFGERIPPRALAGIGVGALGGIVLAAGDRGAGSALFGDLLALLGAVAIVGYILAGRHLRRRLPALAYNSAVYTGTAVLLLLGTLASGEPLFGYPPATYLWLVLLALVPQVMGHSLLNWSLAHLSATTVAIAVMAEPVISTAAAALLLGERPPPGSLAGGLLILVGVYTALGRG